jgi:hypothetical protein
VHTYNHNKKSEYAFWLSYLYDNPNSIPRNLFTFTSQTIRMELKNNFIHHVYFWLKNPGSKEDLAALIKGLEKLSAVPQIKFFHIGLPADTNRDVIDTTYAVSWLNVFETAEDQDVYQIHPMHLQFIEECKHLWRKVVVYDSIQH